MALTIEGGGRFWRFIEQIQRDFETDNLRITSVSSADFTPVSVLLSKDPAGNQKADSEFGILAATQIDVVFELPVTASPNAIEEKAKKWANQTPGVKAVDWRIAEEIKLGGILRIGDPKSVEGKPATRLVRVVITPPGT